MNESKQTELRGSFGKISDESAEQYRNRLENISNSWMVATVATLDHQSRDVIAKIATSAEERLREATSEVFAKFGETLRERLQQIAAGFEPGKEIDVSSSCSDWHSPVSLPFSVSPLYTSRQLAHLIAETV